MDEYEFDPVTIILASYSYKADVIIELLLEKGVISKGEFNNKIESLLENKSKDPNSTPKLIEELKEKLIIK